MNRRNPSTVLFALAVVAAPVHAQEAAAAAEAANYGFLSVLPPLVAIGMALAFRQVIPALFVGLWFGAWTLNGFDIAGLFKGLLETVEVYVRGSLADSDNAAIILFSLMIGGMVGIISRNGGMQGVVNAIAHLATSARRACLATGLMGLAVFFDDYANTLVVGNAMRPVTDRLRVSREKLAYIVDSTAAPVACLALVTTWIGYQVGLIDDALTRLGAEQDAYAVFLGSVVYSFYPILAIFFVFLVVGRGRDFGAMLVAERRARHEGEVSPDVAGAAAETMPEEIIEPHPDRPQRALNAVIPVATLVLTVIGGLFVTGGGEGKNVREIIGDADSYRALLWGSLLGVFVAAALSIGQRVLSLAETVDAWFRGTRSMLFAMIILVLAWSLSGVTEALGTAEFLAQVLGDAVPAGVLPAMVFLLAAATAFATGSSWGTMGILMPLIVPLLWTVTGGLEANPPVIYGAIASVLAGAVWGDHCSPISDTTVLSSMASGCNHIEHVRTQLPYAMLVGMVALIVAVLPSGFGVPWWICLLLSAALLAGFLQFAGQRAEDR
ncbi:MAG: Na+/H+ antiporter NhaC family protein [Pseudomonadota bacterium]